MKIKWKKGGEGERECTGKIEIRNFLKEEPRGWGKEEK